MIRALRNEKTRLMGGFGGVMSWYEYKPEPSRYEPDADSETYVFMAGIKAIGAVVLFVFCVAGLLSLLF